MELDTPLSLSQEITSDSTKKNDGIRAIAMNTSWFIWRTGRWLEFFTNSQKLFLHVTTYDMAVCCDTRSPNHCYTALIQNSFFFFFFLVYGMDKAQEENWFNCMCKRAGIHNSKYTSVANVRVLNTVTINAWSNKLHKQVNLLILCHEGFS